jgi:hypothetical protein
MAYRMASLVEKIARFSHKQLPEAAKPHERTALQRQIEATDGLIDWGQALQADGRGDRDCAEGERVEAFGESL